MNEPFEVPPEGITIPEDKMPEFMEALGLLLEAFLEHQRTEKTNAQIDVLVDELVQDKNDPANVETTRQALQELVDQNGGDVFAAMAQLAGAETP